MEKEDILRYLLYVAIIFIICLILLFTIGRWYTKEMCIRDRWIIRTESTALIKICFFTEIILMKRNRM